MKKHLFTVFILITIIFTFSYEPVRILHINDFHGHLLPEADVNGNLKGGIARIANEVRIIKKALPNTLFIDGGDFISGYLYANYDTGESVATIYENLPLDMFTLGNHEFDYGFSGMRNTLKRLSDKALCANVFYKGKPLYKQFKIVKTGNLRILYFGITTTMIERFSPDIKKLGIEVREPAVVVNDILKKNHDKADIFVMISHQGLDNDMKIAEQFSDLDIIIGGHSHTLVKYPPVVNHTIVTQAGWGGKYLGFLRAFYEKKDGDYRLKYYDSDMLEPSNIWMEDKKIAKLADKAKEDVIRLSDMVIGEATANYMVDKKSVRGNENEMGNLISDSIKELSEAQIGLMNGGGIRSSLMKGPITMAQIEKVLPFKNGVVVVKMKGDELYKAFKNSLSALKDPALSGAFLQISGMKVVYYPDNNSFRLTLDDGRKIEKDEYYVVALNTYILGGGDGYKFDDYEEVFTEISGLQLKDAVAKYIKAKKKVNPYKDGRIQIK